MKFRAEHTFKGISLADYEKLYFDEAFNEALCKSVKLARTLKKRELNGNKLHRELVVGPDREIPAPVAKVLGANRIEYTEHVDYTMGSNRGVWKTISSLMTDKVDTAGTFEFRGSGNNVTRVVDGDIKVKIFGIGGIIEKFIVGDIEKSYEEAARFTQRWIDDGKVKA